MKRAAFDETRNPSDQGGGGKGPIRLRTDFRCVAFGCPNAGPIDDHGEQNRGKCFFHWTADAKDWADVTRQIRADRSMANHGDVPTKPTKTTRDMWAAMRGEPQGLRTVSEGGS